jgi:hypothetical protein
VRYAADPATRAPLTRQASPPCSGRPSAATARRRASPTQMANPGDNRPIHSRAPWPDCALAPKHNWISPPQDATWLSVQERNFSGPPSGRSPTMTPPPARGTRPNSSKDLLLFTAEDHMRGVMLCRAGRWCVGVTPVSPTPGRSAVRPRSSLAPTAVGISLATAGCSRPGTPGPARPAAAYPRQVDHHQRPLLER